MNLRAALGVIVWAALAAMGPALAQPPAAEGEYRLGPEDAVQVRVWGRADLTGEFALDATGRIQLPMVGEVDAGGRTVADVAAYVTKRYQLLDPSIPEVLVSVSKYNSRSVSVVGEVRNPGRLGFETVPDLWSVLLAAGGTTREADLSRVQIVRKEPGAGEPQAVTVDLSRGIEGTPRESLPELRSKDTIIVPVLPANTNVAAGDKVHVLGAVHAPGTYRLDAAGRVIDALAASGGPLPGADLRRVSLTRPTDHGAVSYELNLQDYLTRAKPVVDLPLEPGDIITVPSRRSTLASIVDGIAGMAPFLSVALGLGYALR
jgi:polysaccharide export outer membrane protein